MKESVLEFNETRRPVVVVDTAGDDPLCVKRRPADEERHRDRHCRITQERLAVASIARDDPSTLRGDDPFPRAARMHRHRNAR